MPDGDALPLPVDIAPPEPQQLALAKPCERRKTDRLAEEPAGLAGDLLDRLDREDLDRRLALALPLRSPYGLVRSRKFLGISYMA